MQLRQENLNYMNNTSQKLFMLFLIIFFKTSVFYSQNNDFIKIDGVAAVVGDYVILESDVDKTLIDLQSQGVSTQNIGRSR